MKILGNLAQQYNTYFQWGSACWSDGKGHFFSDRVCYCFMYMTTMWHQRIHIGFKNMYFKFSRPSVVSFVTSVLYFSIWQKEEFMLFSNMQHLHTHVNLWYANILFNWGGRIVHSVKSLMVIILCFSADSFPPTSSGVNIILLWSSLSDTLNNSLGKICFSFWSSIDTLMRLLDIGDYTTILWCKNSSIYSFFNTVIGY